MADQIYLGNFPKGLTTNRTAFNIDNNSFPFLYNMYIWRGRAKRKRGTIFLDQLQVQIEATTTPNFQTSPWLFTGLTLVAGAGNLISGPWTTRLGAGQTLESTSAIVPGSISFQINGTYPIDPTDPTYTEPNPPDGTLLLDGIADPGSTINYATGAVTISGGGIGLLTGTFDYYPGLPVMGLRDFSSSPETSEYPSSLQFDTKRAYEVDDTGSPINTYNVTYYKGTGIPFVWSGEDYQQFWTTNYEGALWATNNKPGFHYLTATYVSGSTTTAITFTFTNGINPFTTLKAGTSDTGDKLWFNEFSGSTINGVTGYVSSVVNAVTGTYVVTFSSAVTVAGAGITQMLSNSLTGQDGIKWYNGDPTNKTGFPVDNSKGWVNFAPPLTGSAAVEIAGYTEKLYYLVGALAILPFKDRLLMFSPYIQSTDGNEPIQLQDTVLWSWNGTPYYTVDSMSQPFNVPENRAANVRAWYVDQTGLGGYLPAGIQNPIKTISNNEDALLIGFGGDGKKTRFVSTGNDFQPFLFFSINSELPSNSTFSAVSLDTGAIDIGAYGIAFTDQQSSKRIDLDIPDEVFRIKSSDFGTERVNSVRDFFRQWIYFSYPVNDSQWKFPTETFLYNYTDNTWAILYENWTAHGNYRASTSYTWATLPYNTWTEWREPWNSGSASSLFPAIIAGNPQGYVLKLGEGTGEGKSGTINAITNNGGYMQITSYNHCVSASDQDDIEANGDYLYLQNLLQPTVSQNITEITKGTTTIITFASNTIVTGQAVLIDGVVGMTELNGNTYNVDYAGAMIIEIDVDSTEFTTYVSGGTADVQVNGQIGKVKEIVDINNFVLDIPYPGAGYLGLGNYTRLSQPLLQTKQFPFYWEQGRQVTLLNQKYLLDTTANGEVTVNIYLSQDSDDAWNSPLDNVPPSSLIYTQQVFTKPEVNNLQSPIGAAQAQMWHRMNTSLQGDSVQLGITLNDAQMRDLDLATSEIALHGIQLTVQPGPLLA